jgi:hypothetical protein
VWLSSFSSESLASIIYYLRWSGVILSVLVALCLGIVLIFDTELSRRREPRTLSAEQRGRFQAIIRSGPKRPIGIVFPAGDYEAYQLAEQFVNIFSAEGWEAALPTELVHFVPDIEGIVIQAADLDAARPYIFVLQRAFAAINMPARIKMDDSGLRGTLDVLVGHKPSR